jgi:hypothetical protein
LKPNLTPILRQYYSLFFWRFKLSVVVQAEHPTVNLPVRRFSAIVYCLMFLVGG